MKSIKVWSVLSLVLAGSVVALAQDPMKVDPSHYKVLIDNAVVRVLHISYPAGAKSPMHEHPDAIVVPLTAATVKFGLPDGTSKDSDMTSESATYNAAGKHSPTNMGKATMEAILVEFKGAAPGKAALPSSRPGMTVKVLAEGPRGQAFRSTAAADFAEAAGTKHDFDQVVIALGPTALSLSIDGKPAKTTWARGDVQFIGRGVAHEAKNTGGKPSDMIIVAIR